MQNTASITTSTLPSWKSEFKMWRNLYGSAFFLCYYLLSFYDFRKILNNLHMIFTQTVENRIVKKISEKESYS